jgi:hypothetical protein
MYDNLIGEPLVCQTGRTSIASLEVHHLIVYGMVAANGFL